MIGYLGAVSVPAARVYRANQPQGLKRAAARSLTLAASLFYFLFYLLCCGAWEKRARHGRRPLRETSAFAAVSPGAACCAATKEARGGRGMLPSCGGQCLTRDVRGYYHLGRRKYAGPFCGSGVWVSGESRLTGEPGVRCSFAQESAGLELRQGAGATVSCPYKLALALAAVPRNRAGLKAGGTMYRARTTRRLAPRNPRCLACC